VVVSGGVLSGLGKGIIASSVAVLLKASSCRITSIKIDPYLNTGKILSLQRVAFFSPFFSSSLLLDSGTMSPFEHGECFVLHDGGEVDLDLGNYERFLGCTLNKDNNITTGKIYKSVIEKERRGDYLGKTVQVIPHICDEISDWIERVALIPVDDSSEGHPDICVIELGGTIGDIESMPFVEALRQFQFRVGRENMCFLHVSLIPTMGSEQKSKPTQHSVRELRSLGLTPDLIMCRSTEKLDDTTKAKISSFCHVPSSNVIGVHNVNNLYAVPVLLESQGVDKLILERLGRKYDATEAHAGFRYWREIEEKSRLLNLGMTYLGKASIGPATIHIALVGKYTTQKDSYLSVIKALQHACFHIGKVVEILWVEATDLLEADGEARKKLEAADGILLPGGFGERGIEGMVIAANYARENNIPFLGICLGFQIGVIEFARNVLKLEKANSTEFDVRTKHDVVIFMPEGDAENKGGTMRLGARDTVFLHKDKSILYNLYGKKDTISERHRHRYEVNPKYVPDLEEKGMLFVGRAVADSFLSPEQEEKKSQNEDVSRNEIFEIEGLKYFVGVQFHSELTSNIRKPSPPFLGLIKAIVNDL
jgi:CTP synthase